MILTVTLNPLLEKIFECSNLKFNSVNRCGNSYFRAGGKGINVSRQLNKLGIKNTALTFLGGTNGKILRKVLMEEGIDFNAVSSKGETRTSSVFYDPKANSATTVMENGTDISMNEADEFLSRLDKAIQNCSAVALMGSSPSPTCDNIYKHGIELAKKYDKFCIADTYGSHLAELFDSAPEVIHNNISEIEKSLNIKLKNETDIEDFLKDLYKNGIKVALLTDGTKPSYAMQFGFIYKIEQPVLPVVDSQGSGDSFTAGYLYGFDRSLIFMDSIKIAASLGALNASMFDVSSVEYKMIEDYIHSVKVTPVGKKLKLIDDSPTI